MLRLLVMSLVIGGAIGLVGSLAFWWADGVAEVAELVIGVVAGVFVVQRVVLTRLLHPDGRLTTERADIRP